MLVQGLSKLIITSPFGKRTRNGIKEFHPGIDIRVYNKSIDPEAHTILPIIAPEKISITDIKFHESWGHYIKAVPFEPNPLGIIEFRFWHITPSCNPGDIKEKDEIIGKPESGYVALHLHFETRIDYRGTTPIDPIEYLQSRGQKYGK